MKTMYTELSLSDRLELIGVVVTPKEKGNVLHNARRLETVDGKCLGFFTTNEAEQLFKRNYPIK